MKKQIRLAFALLAVGAVFLAVQPGVAQAATKKVTVTVKYVNAKYGNKLSTKKYTLKVGQKKSLKYLSFTGYGKKKGSFTFKAGKKNFTKTIKMNPNKVTLTVLPVNEKTGKTIYENTLYADTVKKVYKDYVGKKVYWYTSRYGYVSKEIYITIPTKSTTQKMKMTPKQADVIIHHQDIYGRDLYSDTGSTNGYKGWVSKVKGYYEVPIAVQPLSGFSGYTSKVESVLPRGTGEEHLYTKAYTPKKKTIIFSLYNYSNFIGTVDYVVEYGKVNSDTIKLNNYVAYPYITLQTWKDFQDCHLEQTISAH